MNSVLKMERGQLGNGVREGQTELTEGVGVQAKEGMELFVSGGRKLQMVEKVECIRL